MTRMKRSSRTGAEFPAVHGEDHSGADIHTTDCRGHQSRWKSCAAHRESMLEQAPGRNCGLWRGVHAGGFMAGPVTL